MNQDKKDLEKEVSDLAKDLENLLEKDTLSTLTESKKEKEKRRKKLKKEYKKAKQERNKNLHIKNLLITSRIALIALPYVLSCTLAPTFVLGVITDWNFKNTTTIEEEWKTFVIYEDNTNTSLELKDQNLIEQINIKTPWIPYEEDLYIRENYIKKMTIENEEQRKEIVNSDYTELLNKYSFSSPSVEIKAKDNIPYINEAEISVIDKETKKVSETKTRKEFDTFEYIAISLSIIGGLALGGLLDIALRQKNVGEKIQQKIKNRNENLQQNTKENVKRLKKKYKNAKKK